MMHIDSGDLTNVILGFFGFIGTAWGAWLGFRTKSIENTTRETHAITSETRADVNSDRTKMIAEVQRLNDLVTRLSTQLGISEERGQSKRSELTAASKDISAEEQRK